MDATMFDLRSFVHQRLFAAAEEILGEVEKTIASATCEPDVSRSKEEVQSPRHQLDLLRKKPEPSLTSSRVKHVAGCDVPPLPENPGPSKPEESHSSLDAEAPGASRTGADPDHEDWNHCLVQADFSMSQIKGEREEPGEESGFPPPDILKREQDPAEARVSFEPLAGSAAQVENIDRDEESVNGRGEPTNTMKRKENTRPWQGRRVSVNDLDRAALSSDNRGANGEKGRSFCHFCGKGFQYIGSLMKHIKTHENNVDCTVCGMSCLSSNELLTHVQDFHNKTYFCDVCAKTFSDVRCLRLHERIHAGKKEFACQECDKTFYRREHLIVHVRTHSGEKPYHCDICGKAFSQSQNLTIHKRSHSGEKPYQCGLCGKLFNTSSHLKTHMRYHSGEKPYPCDICGKRFSQSGQMTRHRTTHTGERPYCCRVCGMRYRFAPNLKVHLQTHEKE
ncbi:uncharacterized protein AB9W97_000742 [Spinachia spinachia]